MAAIPPILEMRSITKEFPGVKALANVSITVQAGEIHAICGENGAGKSTLMKVLSGVYPYGTYDGDIVYQGEEVALQQTSARARRAGIVIIHQELALIPRALDHREHLPRQRAEPRRRHRLERGASGAPASCWPASGSRDDPDTLDQEHRRRQAAARRDRQGAQQVGQAAHPRRADRRAQRVGLAAPARPDRRPQGQGHHARS